jgi:hypothetical protein
MLNVIPVSSSTESAFLFYINCCISLLPYQREGEATVIHVYIGRRWDINVRGGEPPRQAYMLWLLCVWNSGAHCTNCKHNLILNDILKYCYGDLEGV